MRQDIVLCLAFMAIIAMLVVILIRLPRNSENFQLRLTSAPLCSPEGPNPTNMSCCGDLVAFRGVKTAHCLNPASTACNSDCVKACENRPDCVKDCQEACLLK